MQRVEMAQLVDLAIGTPEVGAVNFNALHTLLHAILAHLKCSTTNVLVNTDDTNFLTSKNKMAPKNIVVESRNTTPSNPSSAADDTVEAAQLVGRSPYHELERRVARLDNELLKLQDLPSTADVLKIVDTRQDAGNTSSLPVQQIYQNIKLDKRVTANEDCIAKLAKFMEDLMERYNKLRALSENLKTIIDEELPLNAISWMALEAGLKGDTDEARKTPTRKRASITSCITSDSVADRLESKRLSIAETHESANADVSPAIKDKKQSPDSKSSKALDTESTSPESKTSHPKSGKPKSDLTSDQNNDNQRQAQKDTSDKQKKTPVPGGKVEAISGSHGVAKEDKKTPDLKASTHPAALGKDAAVDGGEPSTDSRKSSPDKVKKQREDSGKAQRSVKADDDRRAAQHEDVPVKINEPSGKSNIQPQDPAKVPRSVKVEGGRSTSSKQPAKAESDDDKSQIDGDRKQGKKSSRPASRASAKSELLTLEDDVEMVSLAETEGPSESVLDTLRQLGELGQNFEELKKEVDDLKTDNQKKAQDGRATSPTKRDAQRSSPTPKDGSGSLLNKLRKAVDDLTRESKQLNVKPRLDSLEEHVRKFVAFMLKEGDSTKRDSLDLSIASKGIDTSSLTRSIQEDSSTDSSPGDVSECEAPKDSGPNMISKAGRKTIKEDPSLYMRSSPRSSTRSVTGVAKSKPDNLASSTSNVPRNIREASTETTGPSEETTGPGNETTGPGNETMGPDNETTGPGNETTGPSEETAGQSKETTGRSKETAGQSKNTPGIRSQVDRKPPASVSETITPETSETDIPEKTSKDRAVSMSSRHTSTRKDTTSEDTKHKYSKSSDSTKKQKSSRAGDHLVLVGEAINAKLKELQDRIKLLEERTSGLLSGRELKLIAQRTDEFSERIQNINDDIKRLGEEKADMDYIGTQIDMKADNTVIDEKVNNDIFADTCNQINTVIKDIFGKLSLQEDDLKNVLTRISDDLDNKLDRIELNNLKNWLENRLKRLNDKISRPADFEDEAAGIKKQLLQRFNCISCDRPLEIAPSGPIASIPFQMGLASVKSPRPYTTFELDQIRQHQKGIPRAVLQEMEKQAAANRVGMGKRFDLKAFVVHFEDKKDILRRIRGEEVNAEPYDHYTIDRACGGHHTVTAPSRRGNKPNSFVGQALSDNHGIVTMKPVPRDELEIVGTDGRVYHGRQDEVKDKAMYQPAPATSDKITTDYDLHGDASGSFVTQPSHDRNVTPTPQ